MISGVHFDEATHTYTLDGKTLPSVTQVIKAVLAPDEYATVPAHVLEHAAQRGRAVDQMIELDLADNLDPESLDPELIPYWQAWENFPERLAWRYGGAQCQMSVASPYGYAGTFDIYVPDSCHLIDVKATAAVPKTVGVQTAAYAEALRACSKNPPPAVTRSCLHVTPTGCKLIQLNDPSDFTDFLAALRVFNWRKQNGY